MNGPRLGQWCIAALAVPVLAAGCCGPPRVAAHEPEPDRPAALASIAQRSEDLRSLSQLESNGTARIPVPREDGSTAVEQLDLLLVMQRPSRTALRLKLSVSDVLAWLGSDDQSWWLFLPGRSPSIAYRGPLAGGLSRAQLDSLDEAPVPRELRSPRLLWILAGLEPFGGDVSTAAWDPVMGGWRLEESLAAGSTESIGPVIRRWFSPNGDQITRVEVLDSTGSTIAASRLSEHVLVEVPDRPMGAWPLVARRMTWSTGNAGDHDRAEIALDRPTAQGTRVKPALFDWTRLVESLRPDSIIEVSP